MVYAYCYPVPDNFNGADPTPDAAYWHEELGEFLLPYAQIISSPDPDATLLAFLEETYAVVADRGGWDRANLEIPRGSFGHPYDVRAHRA